MAPQEVLECAEQRNGPNCREMRQKAGGAADLAQGGLSMGWVPAARGRDDLCPVLLFAAVRLPMPMAAGVRVRVGVRAPERPSAAFLLRAGAKLAENDGNSRPNV